MPKLATWNVNGLRKLPTEKLDQLLAIADVLLVQELRLPRGSSDWPSSISPKHHIAMSLGGAAGRGGVMTVSRIKPSRIVIEPIHRVDAVGRSLLTCYREFSVLNLYVPHGRRDRHEVPQKLQYLDSVCRFTQGWDGPPLLIGGDLNVALEPLDCARRKQNATSALFSSEIRQVLGRLLNLGYRDYLRELNPTTEGLFTWWPYAFNARERNIGWRIDYILAPTEIECLTARHLPQISGSDHCPTLLGFSTRQ